MLDKQITKNTLVDYPRLDKLIYYIQKTKWLPGDLAEVGVYKGGTAYLLRQFSSISKKLYLFDTFEGLPEVNQYDLHHKGDFNDTSLQKVDELLNTSKFLNYSIYKGIFPNENSEYIKHKTFSLVHLDVDIYDSIKNCLEFFTPRMEPGGVIILDDYNEPNCPGAKLAANNFALANNLLIELTVQSQAIIQF